MKWNREKFGYAFLDVDVFFAKYLFLSKISAIFSPFGSVCQCRDTEGLFLLCSCKINLSEVCENCEKELFCRNKKTFYQKMLSKKTEYRTIDTAKL